MHASTHLPADENLQTILQSAISIARAAGAILLEGRDVMEQHKGEGIRYKTSDIDPVTEYDVRSEQYISGELRRLFPHHRLIGEEGGTYEVNTSTPEADTYTWHIDPLDGTVNFAHGFPLYCVSLGLLRGEEPVLGVIYLPASNELFAASKGSGATLNGKPIQVSPTTRLDQALLATGFSYDTHTNDSNIRNFLGFQHTAQATRRIGSCAINLSYLAAGRWDGYWELKTKTYDIAAGIVLVREAGGCVTDFDNGNGMLHSGRIVASNGPLHTAMLDVLAAAGDRE
jgi:myo-inositol-1(or 4)-monophosphatase